MPEKKDTKWIIITGGVLSGLGKGTATASIARLLKDHNKIVNVKCDGYLNMDPGTMNPIEHGEVFVLNDGGEVDMDFGHYERFLGTDCKFQWNITSGKVFNAVISKERRGEYLGKTIQIFPHVIEDIKNRLHTIAEKEEADIMMVEIGGTVGDIENSWFIEAVRELKKEVGQDNILYIHLTYVPFLSAVGEPKTKPAQRDIALLREKGISPDIIIARSKDLLPKKIKNKLTLFCDVDSDCIISGKDIGTIYEIPLIFKKEGILNIINRKLKLNADTDLTHWEELVNRIKNPKKQMDIAICGKYTELRDSYASIIESLIHCEAHLDVGINLKWIETTEIEKGNITAEKALEGVKGIIVPGGFGVRGVEGKIELIKYARENDIPFLGLCFGLQLAVAEFARNVCGLEGAHSTEVDPLTKYPVIDILTEQKGITEKGATMRLGTYKADVKDGTLMSALYQAKEVHERHRHRYEVNPDYHEILEKHGLIISGYHTRKDGTKLVEFIELPNGNFRAAQGHPEFKSRLEKPAPFFLGFVKDALKYENQTKQ